MGMYPRQEFIYGIGKTEEVDIDFDNLENFCEKNGYEYVVGGDYGDSWNSGVVIGRKRPNYLWSCECTPEGKYLGGYHVAPFNIERFNEWYESVKGTLTTEDINKINRYLNVKEEPKLYTVSTRQ